MPNWIGAFTVLSAIIALAGQIHHDQNSQDENGTRVLDEITSTAPRPDIAAPQTGELLLRPIYFLQGRSGSNVSQIDLYFSPIVDTPDGVPEFYADQEPNRIRILARIPLGLPTGTRLYSQRRESYKLGVRSVELPAGSYVLSQIRYTYTRSPLPPDIYSYCLSEETYIFDVKSGQSQFLGELALRPLPRNRAHLKRHHPLFGIDGDLSLISDIEGRYPGDIQPVEINMTPFVPEKICQKEQVQTTVLTPGSRNNEN